MDRIKSQSSIDNSRETNLETYFKQFRQQIIGIDQTFESPYGAKKIIYADWTASGRLYRPIEDRIVNELGPYVGNTHTETTVTGTSMTMAYQEARQIIKKHVNAGPRDVIIMEGSGMTGVVNKFQRILGLRVPERFHSKMEIPENDRPVVFVSHMEHHSNHTSWLETVADVECIIPSEEGLINLNYVDELVKKYRDRKTKIASITACSNVTGIMTCYHDVARKMHQHGGLCFVDFACSAPYVQINMHPEDPLQKLDAIYFSPHKFLGGPGSTGILIFDSRLYQNQVPDQPGGGTVSWTNPWGGHRYFEDIESREDGGTPAFLPAVKAALAVKLKEQMGVDKINQRERGIVHRIFSRLDSIPNLHLLAPDNRQRLGVISFYVDDLHYELGVKLLNDRFGIQMRGGCSCAGTYGHYLLNISPPVSQKITDEIDHGDFTDKPGWIRMSIHPVLTDQEIETICDAVEELTLNFQDWSCDYVYDPKVNQYFHKNEKRGPGERVKGWFEL